MSEFTLLNFVESLTDKSNDYTLVAYTWVVYYCL